MLKRILLTLALAGLLVTQPITLTAQATFTATTLSSPVAVGADQIQVASTSGMSRNNVIVIDREAMRINDILPGNVVKVSRGTDGTVAQAHASGALVYHGSPQAFGPLHKLPSAFVIRSADFNIDNGAGTTLDSVFPVTATMRIWGCRVSYGETAGTVASANVRIGTSVGGGDVVSAKAYTNGATAGTVEHLTLLKNRVDAPGVLIIRHTGVAATAAGIATVQCDVSFE